MFVPRKRKKSPAKEKRPISFAGGVAAPRFFPPRAAGEQYFCPQVHKGGDCRQHYGCNFLERNNKRWKKTTP
jgi:hypothetical protein